MFYLHYALSYLFVGYNYDQNDHIHLNNIHGNLTSHLQGISLPTHRPPPMTNPSSVPASSVMLGPIGAYSAEMRKERIDRFMEKRKKRVWTKKVWFRTVCSYVYNGCYLK